MIKPRVLLKNRESVDDKTRIANNTQQPGSNVEKTASRNSSVNVSDEKNTIC